MYKLRPHTLMVGDRVRLDAYRRSLEQTVRPGSVVLDVGTGSGILALLACRLGARRVFAIEPDPIIGLARELAAKNNCADRISFLPCLSTEVESLPERPDLAVSDLRGSLPFYGNHIAAIADIRRRLAPGATLVPQQDRVFVASVSAPELYARYVQPWKIDGLECAPAFERACNSQYGATFASHQQISEARQWATLDYDVAPSPDASGEVELPVVRPGLAHGLALWFDTTLCPGIGFSNAPGQPTTVYGAQFIPWPRELSTEIGDQITLALRFVLTGDHYAWRIETQVRRGSAIQAEFDQSNLWSVLPASANDLRRAMADHVPGPVAEAQIDAAVLAAMDGKHSLAQIGAELRARWPLRFRSEQEAIGRAAKVSSRYQTD